MAEVKDDGENPSHLQNVKITDSQRRTRLMKKLHKIKLSQTLGNFSFYNNGEFYERKFQRLKRNNVSLAKALAEQRQVSQSWYDEVVSLKEELHETRGDLLRYQVSNNVNDNVIQIETERRIKEIAAPLESAAKECLDHVLGVVDSMTKVKQLIASLLKIKNDKLSTSTLSASNGLRSSRPLLTKSSKSPRKNVVHPMVGGHVLQPATIHLPRMTLEERRRYRLQERTESVEEIEASNMSTIGEHSISFNEENTEEVPLEEIETPDISFQTSSESTNEQPSPLSVGVLTAEGNVPTDIPILEPIPSNTSIPNDIAASTPTSEAIPETSLTQTKENSFEDSPDSQASATKSGSSKCKRSLEFEDPLEGSSWMHLKRKKGSKKRNNNNCNSTSLRRTNPLVMRIDSSSDSEDERNVKKCSKRSSQKVSRNSNASAVGECLPMLCLIPVDEINNKVTCRRSARTTRTSQRSTKNNDFTSHMESPSVQLPSFIINDSPETESNSHDAETICALENKSLSIASSSSNTISPTLPNVPTTLCSLSSLPVVALSYCDLKSIKSTAEVTSDSSQLKPKIGLEEETSEMKEENITATMDSSKKVGKGSPKNSLKVSKTSKRHSSENNDESNKGDSDKPEKENFSKRLVKEELSKQKLESKKEVVQSQNSNEKVQNDIMLKDTSSDGSDTLKKGKENVPPKDSATALEVSMNLKNVSIVVEDIMKTQNLTSDFSIYSFENNKCKKRKSSERSRKSSPAKNKSYNKSQKKLKNKQKPKVSYKRTNRNKSKANLSPLIQDQSPCNNHSSTDSVNTAEDGASSLIDKKHTVPKLKIKICRNSKTALSELNSHVDDSLFECNSDTFIGFDSDLSGLENNNTNCQVEHPKERQNLDFSEAKQTACIKADEIIDDNNCNNDPLDSIDPFISSDPIVTSDSDPIFNEILEEVTTLLRDNLEYDKFDPLALPLENEIEDEVHCVCQKFIPTPPVEETRDSFNSATSVELVKARPRRAAAKLISFKEPSLNTKLRRETTKTKF